ncbi:type II toxin-antitoxin system RelE/ParE family toxin [Spirosoma areae]
MTVYFSAEAESQLDELATYLGEAWSQKTKTDFLALLSDKLELISQMPEMYRKSEKRPGLRECVINKQAILYYQIQPEAIEVVAILSTRRGSDE